MMVSHNKEVVNIIDQIPMHSVGAEIGVWMGGSSSQFLNRRLKHLHLVDSWSVEPYKNTIDNEHGSYENYLQKYAKLTGSVDPNAFQKYYDKVYGKVRDKFLDNLNVTIHRGTSNQFFDQFNKELDELLDWVYIDGDHSFSGCLNDLERSLEVLKPGGLILGDDYRWPKQQGMKLAGKDGVTQAVDEFIKLNPSFKIQQFGNTQFRIDI